MSTIDTSNITHPTGSISSVNSGTSETAALSGLDKDAFLKLLVAQLRYQNPMSPMDGQEYLAQAAQFATVERLEGLARAQAEMIAYQKVAIAASFVGRNVRGLDSLGQQVEGTVRSVHFVNGGAVLDVDGHEVMLETVETITADEPPAEEAVEKTDPGATEGRTTTDSNQEETAQ